MVNRKVDELAETIWNYLRLNQPLEKSDVILALGSHDKRVGSHAARLFLDEWAPLLLFSGGRGAITQDLWDRSEAQVYAETAMELGVPESKILLETKSRNTGENIRFTRSLVESKSLNLRKIMVVHKPYMERRIFAAMKKQWPQMEVVVTSPPVSYRDYPNEVVTRREFINTMVGDLQRLVVYAEKGFQTEQEIPTEIWSAFTQLVELGYDRRLVAGESWPPPPQENR